VASSPSTDECIEVLKQIKALGATLNSSEEVQLRIAGERIMDIAQAQLFNFDLPDLSQPLG
jgi:DNA-binding FrmR family transcriptional regulator